MAKFYHYGTVGILILILGGCTQHKVAMEHGFGNALKLNMAAQTANPAPRYEDPAVSAGTRAALALERYNTDRTEKLIEQRTTQVGSGDGG